jgi:hypothetical protein
LSRSESAKLEFRRALLSPKHTKFLLAVSLKNKKPGLEIPAGLQNNSSAISKFPDYSVTTLMV